MSGIREWSAVICMAALVASMAQSMIPNGSMEKMEKFIIGAFVICALIQPVTQIAPKLGSLFTLDTQTQDDTSALEKTVDSQIETSARQSIANLVAAELSTIHIKYKNVQVDMDTSENGSIQITKVTVILDEQYAAQCSQAQELLQKDLGIQTEVVCDDG